MASDPAVLKKVSVAIEFPFFKMEAEWEADPRERQAAWELYVEFSTRVATRELTLDDGLLREVLGSLHSLFGISREILRRGGPEIGMRGRSVGYLALGVLNNGLRPFLAKWHPRLGDWELSRLQGTGAFVHQRAWSDEVVLRGELEKMRQELTQTTKALAHIAGIDR